MTGFLSQKTSPPQSGNQGKGTLNPGGEGSVTQLRSAPRAVKTVLTLVKVSLRGYDGQFAD